MSTTQSQRTLEEVTRLGKDVLNRVITPELTPEDHGKYLAIAVDYEDYEIAEKGVDAIKALLAKHPGCMISLERVGYPTTFKLRGFR